MNQDIVKVKWGASRGGWQNVPTCKNAKINWIDLENFIFFRLRFWTISIYSFYSLLQWTCNPFAFDDSRSPIEQSPYPSYFTFEINVGKGRIRQRTILNDVIIILSRCWYSSFNFRWWRHSISLMTSLMKTHEFRWFNDFRKILRLTIVSLVWFSSQVLPRPHLTISYQDEPQVTQPI